MKYWPGGRGIGRKAARLWQHGTGVAGSTFIQAASEERPLGAFLYLSELPPVKEKIETLIAGLHTAFKTYQRMLAELEEKREKLRESMLRIAGAIQVLEEIGGERGDERDEKEKTHVCADEQS